MTSRLWVRFYIAELKHTVLNSWCVKNMGVRKGAKRAFTPLEIETNNQNFLENLTSASICRYDTHTAQEPGSLFWCHAVMNLQFTHVRSFACRGSLPNLREDCFTVGFYCATIP